MLRVAMVEVAMGTNCDGGTAYQLIVLSCIWRSLSCLDHTLYSLAPSQPDLSLVEI